MTLIVKYPPYFDGELHIKANMHDRKLSCEYSFIHSTSKEATGVEGANEWQTLVAAAKAIIAQDERRKSHPQPNRPERTLT